MFKAILTGLRSWQPADPLFHFCMFWCPLTFSHHRHFWGGMPAKKIENEKLGCNQSHAGEVEVDVGSSGALVL